MADTELAQVGSPAGAGQTTEADPQARAGSGPGLDGNAAPQAGATKAEPRADGSPGLDGNAAPQASATKTEPGADGSPGLDGNAAPQAGTAEASPAAEPDQRPGSAGPGASPAAAIGRHELLRGAGLSLLLLALVALGFAGYLYGLSSVQEARAQTVLYTRLQAELSQVGGVAPPLNPPIAAGSPIVVLDIPSIGVRDMVVVQGTSPENLTAGPGHLPTTPFPGQPGMAVIYGRRATFGAPFGRIGQLRAGDTIKAVTGQGSFTYRVAAVADSTKTIEDPAPNRLLLLTASSPVIPTYYTQVDADLVSSVQPSPGVAPSITGSELPMAGDSGALALTLMWSLALLLVSAGGTIAAVRWSRWVAYLVAVPLALAVLLNLYQNLAALLPNLY
jgi:sortase A